MERAAATSQPSDLFHFPGRDEDISIVRDVAKKTFETLELNVKTCLKITKLVDAIKSDQITGIRRWSRRNSDSNLWQFKEHIDSLRRKADAWLAMRCSALESGSKLDGETCTTLALAMMDLQTIDRRFREEIAGPLEIHLMRKTPPDYTRLQEIALPLIQDALKRGDIIKQEFIRLRATSAPPVAETNETARDSSCAPHNKSSWQPFPPMVFGQRGSSNENPHLVEEGRAGGALVEGAIAIGSEGAMTTSTITLCT